MSLKKLAAFDLYFCFFKKQGIDWYKCMSEVCEDHLLKTQFNFVLRFLCSDKVTNEGGVLHTSPKPSRGSYNCLLSRGWNNGNIGRKDKDIASIDIGEPVMKTKFLTVFHEKHHTKDRLEAIRASKRDHEETTQNDPIRQQSAGPKTYQIRMINGSPGSC